MCHLPHINPEVVLLCPVEQLGRPVPAGGHLVAVQPPRLPLPLPLPSGKHPRQTKVGDFQVASGAD